MRAVVQRVSKAQVRVGGAQMGTIARGLLVLLGVAQGDTESDAQWMAAKLAGLRIFEDDAGKMNLDVSMVGGRILLVSQFTLLGDARKGTRPSFTEAAPAALGEQLYERVAALLAEKNLTPERGKFGAHMEVELTNDGPVTILLDSKKG